MTSAPKATASSPTLAPMPDEIPVTTIVFPSSMVVSFQQIFGAAKLLSLREAPFG